MCACVFVLQNLQHYVGFSSLSALRSTSPHTSLPWVYTIRVYFHSCATSSFQRSPAPLPSLLAALARLFIFCKTSSLNLKQNSRHVKLIFIYFIYNNKQQGAERAEKEESKANYVEEEAAAGEMSGSLSLSECVCVRASVWTLCASPSISICHPYIRTFCA